MAGIEIPAQNPDRDALLDYGLTALDAALPILGGVVADLSRGILARQAGERQHAFNVTVAAAIAGLLTRVDGLTIEGIVESDEFMAAFSIEGRVAAETESKEKRARLASALAHMGPWDEHAKARREFFFDLVVRYSDQHVFLLAYFRDPVAWLNSNAASWTAGMYMMAGVSTVLEQHVFVDDPDWRTSVVPAVGDLIRDGLADVPLKGTMTGDGTVAKRTLQLGDQFLDFLKPD